MTYMLILLYIIMDSLEINNIDFIKYIELYIHIYMYTYIYTCIYTYIHT